MDVTLPAAVFRPSQVSAQPMQRQAIINRRVDLVMINKWFGFFMVIAFDRIIKFDGFVKSRHPGESRGPGQL